MHFVFHSISFSNPVQDLVFCLCLGLWYIIFQVRDELEQLLDDDGDMAEMYLTDKLEQQQFQNSPASSINEEDDDLNRHLKPFSHRHFTI